MKIAQIVCIGFAAAALAANSISARADVDQSQSDGSVWMASFYQTDLAQSFQQTNSNISGASVYLWNTGYGAGDVTISVYNALPSNNGNLLASGTDDNVADGGVATVSFAPTALTPNQTYYLVFTDSNGDQGIAGSVNNPYSKGMVFANQGYMAFPSYDYTFQTFSSASLNATPEPSAVAGFLFGGLGLTGLALCARKRRAQTAA